MSGEIDGLDEGPGPEKPRKFSPFGLLVDGLSAIGSVIIGMMMVMICADVIARNAFAAPISGVSELAAMGIVVIVFLSLASTLRNGRMSRAELFIDPLLARHPRIGHALQALFMLAGVAACIIIMQGTLPALERAWVRSEFVGTQGIFTAPTWPVRATVMLGSGVAAVQFLILAWDSFLIALGRRQPPNAQTGS